MQLQLLELSSDLGMKSLNRWWAKLEIFIGLFAASVALMLSKSKS